MISRVILFASEVFDVKSERFLSTPHYKKNLNCAIQTNVIISYRFLPTQ
jgi:hypothetical protein